MKILHFFLAGLSVFLLISAGVAFKKPKNTRECYLQNGTCRFGCSRPLKRHGSCGSQWYCCIRHSPGGNRVEPVPERAMRVIN